MAANIVCSDTYLDAFSKLDKKTQKKALETIRLMQRSLRSDSLKVEKLNTKLDFKSARVTQDFRAIFTQSGNTVLLVYIGHHDDAYLWASRKLQGFDTASAKPVYEYFEQAKSEDYNTIAAESSDSSFHMKSDAVSKSSKTNSKPEVPLGMSDKSRKEAPCPAPPPMHNKVKKKVGFISKVLYFLFGAVVGIIITYFM